MGMSHIKYEEGYSQYDTVKRMSPCRYCGKVLASPTGRCRHIRKFHNNEVVRY